MSEENANAQEIWESTTGGTTWVHVKDARVPGGWRQQKVGGKGTRRLTLTVEEREFNQDLIPFENAKHDPFTNGLLVRISPKVVEERGEYELNDDQLVEILQLGDDETFLSTVREIDSEILMRRLLALSETHSTMTRFREIQQIVDSRYRGGKTSRVVKEIYEDDEKYAAADW